ncbi:MAG: homocysteine S-methyltransferase family protein [Vicinamibacteria bacterium]
MEALLFRLCRGEVLVGDGALGTLLMARGLAPGSPPESFVLERPEALLEIARRYVDAGADLVTSDTFGASALNLASYGLGERAAEINRAAVSLAREAASGRAYVSASVGPTARLLAPLGDVTPEQVREAFEEQMRAQAEAGADLFCIETMSDLGEALLAVQAGRSVAPQVPIAASMSFDATPRGYYTIMGVSVERAACELARAGADVVGSNCGNGSERMVEIARAFHAATPLPLLIQPNAGLPQTVAGRLVHPETPEQMAARVPGLLAAGVQIVGGCCGTTPEHVRAIRAAVSAGRTGAAARSDPA